MPRAALTLALALLIAAFFVRPPGTTARSPETRTVLEQPNGWVPFSANVETTTPGAETQTGRYFRNKDGSERFEAARASDGATIVEILNLRQSTYYVSTNHLGWVSKAMDVGISDRRPRKMYAEMTQLVRYPYKLDLLKGGSRNLRATQGLDAYMYTTGSGSVRLMIPALNFFPVVMQQPAGRAKTFFNIVVGEPSAELFVPPADASVRVSTEPFLLRSRPEQAPIASKDAGGHKNPPEGKRCLINPARQ